MEGELLAQECERAVGQCAQPLAERPSQSRLCVRLELQLIGERRAEQCAQLRRLLLETGHHVDAEGALPERPTVRDRCAHAAQGRGECGRGRLRVLPWALSDPRSDALGMARTQLDRQGR